MSLIDCTVKLGLREKNELYGPFVLDSLTQGLLGTTRLSDLEFIDVTSYVRSVSTNRGRSRQLDDYRAGSATIVLDNRTRIFDPLNEDGPYYGSILPRIYVEITSHGYPIFYGIVTDWDINYDIANNDTVSLSCSDGFSILANMVLSAFTPSAQKTGARVNAILDRTEVNYIGPRTIATGSSDLGAYAVAADTVVLNYLRQVERSEQGSLFIAADGELVFRDRSYVSTVTPPTLSDDGVGIPYQTLYNEFGDELLYNYIRFKSPAGVEQIKSDTASIQVYQISQYSDQEMLNSSTGVLASLASVYLNRYKDPQVRLTGFQIQVAALTDTQIDELFVVDLADYVTVEKTFVTGDPLSFSQLSKVSGIAHQISPGSHTVSYNIESAVGGTFLVLGNSLAGRLDDAMLNF